MQYGINLLLWADTLSDSLLPVVDDIRSIGYDAVELPVFEHDPAKHRVRRGDVDVCKRRMDREL